MIQMRPSGDQAKPFDTSMSPAITCAVPSESNAVQVGDGFALRSAIHAPHLECAVGSDLSIVEPRGRRFVIPIQHHAVIRCRD